MGEIDDSVELRRFFPVFLLLPSVRALAQSSSLSLRRGSVGLEVSGWLVLRRCSVWFLLSGHWRVNGWPPLLWRGWAATLPTLLERLAANTPVRVKVAIISFFIVNCWPYAVESALLNFSKNAFIILPYTHDIHVLAVHVEMSLFMMINKFNPLLLCRLPCLTFKIPPKESNLGGGAHLH